MVEISNEALLAFIDAELDQSEHDLLQKKIEQDAELNARYLRLKGLSTGIAGAYDPMLVRPIPSRLVNAVYPSSATNTHRGWSSQKSALAAGLVVFALGIGFGSGYFSASVQQQKTIVQAQLDNQQAMLMLEQKLNQVLETQRSGTSVSWQSEHAGLEVEITPLRTFKTKEKTYCREYRQVFLQKGIKRTEKNLSCRVDKGQWITKYRTSGKPGTRL